MDNLGWVSTIIIPLVSAILKILDAINKYSIKKALLAEVTYDELGHVNIKIVNCLDRGLPLRALVLLKDKSFFWYWIRILFPLRNKGRFDVVNWTIDVDVPSVVGADDFVELSAVIDPSVMLEMHKKSKISSMNPVAMIQLGRYRGLYNLMYTNELIIRDQDVMGDS